MSEINGMLDVKELTSQHRKSIDALWRICVDTRVLSMATLTANEPTMVFDDIFLLRYIISFKGDKEKAAAAIGKALEWRRTNINLVKMAYQAQELRNVSEFPENLQPYVKTIRNLMTAWSHKKTRDGQPLVLARLGTCNLTTLMSLVPKTILKDYIIFTNEVEYWVCNKDTRRTGKLHKCYRLIDMKNCNTKTLDRRFLKVFSEASKVSEFLHPQLVGRTILLNSPSFIRWIVEVLRNWGVSRRALEKIWVHKQHKNKSIAEHKDILSLLDREQLPTFLGGKCNCADGCVPGCPNDQKAASSIDTETWRKRLEEDLKSCGIHDSIDTLCSDPNDEFFDCENDSTSVDASDVVNFTECHEEINVCEDGIKEETKDEVFKLVAEFEDE